MSSFIGAVPAADRLRPTSFDDMAGQRHLVGENGILRRLVASGRLPSMIFFGPPGTGKTTAASIIAAQSDMTLRRLNATTATLADVRVVAGETSTMYGTGGILLYLDEIQYFNRKQQQSLLEYIEDGRITLIASTSENPYYYVYDALLSRCSVFEFKPVAPADMVPRLRRNFEVIRDDAGRALEMEDACLLDIAQYAAGDMRRATSMLELSVTCVDKSVTTITSDMMKELVPSVMAGNFDRDGDVHYDLLSCLQKSIRGSDPDAAVFYLAKLLEGGDLISPCRRLMVIACEDIGLAYPMAAVFTRSCVEMARELGLPEARIPLADAAVLLATAPKSNSAYLAVAAAGDDIRKGRGGVIPRHLQSPNFTGYKYPHNYPSHYVKQQYLPDDLVGSHYYTFGDNKAESAAAEYWNKIKSNDRKSNI